MNRPELDLVFGRGRLRMATGHHAEVFREESPPGERRRYSKRFLVNEAGDFRPWMEREERILTRLAGLDIAPGIRLEPFDRGAFGRLEQLRTYDAGVTVDHWATLLPVQREGVRLRHVFEDCAHWWALARHCLIVLDKLHAQGGVHLDLKADNVCIPLASPDFDPAVPGAVMTPCFEKLALIDFAFCLLPGEDLSQPLPLAGQTEYIYQSPRLLIALEAGREGDLEPTVQLDWRCDLFSLAAMLRRYLPGAELPKQGQWSAWHLELARNLIWRLQEAHDANEPAQRPHQALVALTKEALADASMSASLRQGWSLAEEAQPSSAELATPPTRIVMLSDISLPRAQPQATPGDALPPTPRAPVRRAGWWPGLATAVAIGIPMAGVGWWAMHTEPSGERTTDTALMAPAKLPSAGPLPTSPGLAPEQVLAPEPKPMATPQSPESFESAAGASAALAMPESLAASAVAATEPRPTVPAAPAPQAQGQQVPPQPTQVQTPQPQRAPAQVTASARGVAEPKVPVRSRTAANPPVRSTVSDDRPWVDQAERERALRWLTMRGPAPRPDMKMPPAPASTPKPGP